MPNTGIIEKSRTIVNNEIIAEIFRLISILPIPAIQLAKIFETENTAIPGISNNNGFTAPSKLSPYIVKISALLINELDILDIKKKSMNILNRNA